MIHTQADWICKYSSIVLEKLLLFKGLKIKCQAHENPTQIAKQFECNWELQSYLPQRIKVKWICTLAKSIQANLLWSKLSMLVLKIRSEIRHHFEKWGELFQRIYTLRMRGTLRLCIHSDHAFVSLLLYHLQIGKVSLIVKILEW